MSGATIRRCIVCGKRLTGLQRKYCGNVCKCVDYKRARGLANAERPSCNELYAMGYTHYCPACGVCCTGPVRRCSCREPLAEMLRGVVAGEHYDRVPAREGGHYGQRRVA